MDRLFDRLVVESDGMFLGGTMQQAPTSYASLAFNQHLNLLQKLRLLMEEQFAHFFLFASEASIPPSAVIAYDRLMTEIEELEAQAHHQAHRLEEPPEHTQDAFWEV